MENIDYFINFIWSNIPDKRIEVSKKLKYGHRYYYISVTLEVDTTNGYRDHKQLMIIVDNRNQIIEVGYFDDFLVFESTELVKKWSDIIEEWYTQNLNERLKTEVEDFFSKAKPNDLDFWRQWSMDKILKDPDDEAKENPTE